MINIITKFLLVLFLLLPFTTSAQATYELPISWHKQEHSLSCEIAALKMALSFYGVEVSETELINELNFDSTARTSNIWGDPFTGFVGNIDGQMMNDGYGVYWQPIADVGSKFRKTEVIQFANPSDLATQIFQNHPVIIWGHYGKGEITTWSTPEGKTIQGVKGEHARTVIGFLGTKEAPTHFIMLDPIYGRLTWSAQQVMENWSPFDNFGVVIYPDAKFVKLSTDQTIWQITAQTRQPLAMSWDKFLSIGGSGPAIKIISSYELSQFTEGAIIR